MPDERRRLAVAIAASVAVVFGAPYVGQIRGAIQAALPGQYRLIIGGTIAASVTVALIVALVRIRERRLLRYGVIVLALAGGGVYAWLTATGNANVDVVERFHFVEYGFLALLFYRAWRDRAHVTSMVFPLLAGTIVGTCDEGIQWLVPARVGEMRDVLLDVAAVGCGLLFSLGLHPPAALSAILDRRARRGLAVFAATAMAIAAVFFYVVHVGHEVDGADAGRFLSRFDARELRAAALDRDQRWRVNPPSVLHRMSIEDHYLAEGLWHIQRRNEGTGLHTWKENLILERFFAPVLEFPTYATPGGARWSPEQRANVEARESHDASAYISGANPYPIYPWNAAAYWGGIGTLIGLVVFSIVRAGIP